MAVTFAKLQSLTGDLNRVQDAIADAFRTCVAVSGLMTFVTADPTGVPSSGAPRFSYNSANSRLWVNVGASWKFVGLT